MKKISILATFSMIFIGLSVRADPGEDFRILLDEHWEWQMLENPVRASRMGDRRWNDRWTDNSLDEIGRAHV